MEPGIVNNWAVNRLKIIQFGNTPIVIIYFVVGVSQGIGSD